MHTQARLLALVLCMLPALSGLPVLAQQPQGPPVGTIWEAYQQLDYAQAVEAARAALDAFESYSRHELAEVHTILGLIQFSQDAPEEARGQFSTALSLNPNLELDSLLVSPKIHAFFEEVRSEMRQGALPQSGDAVPVRYVVVEDRRSEAVLRSMVVPGWGQLHKGERTKGRVLLGLWGATVAGTVTAHLLREQARQDYDRATTPAEAVDRYGFFNQWHQRRNAFLMGAAGIWLFSYVDALITGKPARDQRMLYVAPTFTDHRMQLLLRLQF